MDLWTCPIFHDRLQMFFLSLLLVVMVEVLGEAAMEESVTSGARVGRGW